MDLDRELRHALRRESPPDGFAARVLARIEREQAAPVAPVVPIVRSVSRTWRAVAAAVTLTVMVGAWSAREFAERREAAAGERAREQVLLALRITGAKLQHAQNEVREIGNR